MGFLVCRHQVDYCVTQKVCTECRDKPLRTCVHCGQNQRIFEGKNALDHFCNWLMATWLLHIMAKDLVTNLFWIVSMSMLKWLQKSSPEVSRSSPFKFED